MTAASVTHFVVFLYQLVLGQRMCLVLVDFYAYIECNLLNSLT